ncbi:MAG: DLW-39 family protein [Kineosporiaceae bacterium]
MSRAASQLGGEIAVKKLFVVLALGAAGFAVWKKIEADKAEQALWAEVTDPVT